MTRWCRAAPTALTLALTAAACADRTPSAERAPVATATIAPLSPSVNPSPEAPVAEGTATAGAGEAAAPNASRTAAASAAPPDRARCLSTPQPKRSPTHVTRGAIGCELAPSGPDAWRSVTEVRVAELHIDVTRTEVRFVLLDAQGRRVVPIGKRAGYEVLLTRSHRGQIALGDHNHHEGVFELLLPKDQRPKPCNLHVFVRFHNGREQLEDWLDDWLYGC